MSDSPKVSERERRALTAWDSMGDPDFGYMSFKSIALESGLELRYVRRTVRALARKGFVKFASGLTNEDGDFGGSGYCITDAGIAALDALRAATPAGEG